jgi:hypothetical protein
MNRIDAELVSVEANDTSTNEKYKVRGIEMYDSEQDTRKHISKVWGLGEDVIKVLDFNLTNHDDSKLNSPEKETFDKMTPLLAGCTYGSEEYNGYLKEMEVALDHHYEFNSHHPEHWKHGVQGMSLMNILEMLIDWKAATLRHDDGDIMKSIDINQKRFHYSDELKQILINTVKEMEWENR